MTQPRTGSEAPHWRGDDVEYWGAHQRVYRERGKAAECVWGCEADSYEWANLTGDYLDVWDFAPMCKRCHKRYDGARAMMDRDEIRDQWGHPWKPGQARNRHLGQHLPGGQTGDLPETRSQAHAGQGTRNGSTSRFTGVSSRGRKWAAICGPDYLGCFTDEEDAARAYDAAARVRWGRFAPLNFPE